MTTTPASGSTPVGNPAGWIARAIETGMSQRQALQAFRDAGGAIRDQFFRRTWGEVRSAIARAPNIAGLDPNTLPDTSSYTQWSAGRGGQFATQVNVIFRDRATGLVGSAPYTHITDLPHSPAEAMQAGIDLYARDDYAQQYDQSVLGAVPTGLYETVPYAG